MKTLLDQETAIANALAEMASPDMAPRGVSNFAFGVSWNSSTQTFLWSVSGFVGPEEAPSFHHGSGRCLGLAFQAFEADVERKNNQLRAAFAAMEARK